METELKLRYLVPLTLLYASENRKIKGRTKLQKLNFFAEQNLSDETNLNDKIDFDYYKYDYGPFSKQLLGDLEQLEQEKLIDIDKVPTFSSKRYDHRLTSVGVSAVDTLRDGDSRVDVILDTSEEIISEFGEMSTRQILDYIYEEYPEYREKSVYY